MLFHLPFLYIFYLTHHIKYFSDIFKKLFFSLLSLYLPAWSHCKQCYKGAYRLTSWVFLVVELMNLSCTGIGQGQHLLSMTLSS